jgi:DNA transformation protein
MSASAAFVAHVVDLLSPVGVVSVRRMFGGAGLYLDGHFIAIIDRDVLYFKTDTETRKRFEAEGTGPFVYDTKHGPGQLDSYWRAPERLLDDADEMADWARCALEVARAAAQKKLAKPRRGSAKRAPKRGRR